ncbi:hypothetical protein Ocin01_07418 [Orchesella cincta]|uniref:Uncharacterized protein n=1 Tax=Orchesella cincta TaxID=48709 RepID=A0A1D2N1Z7_ORCCI|nr:hypothetical protein Ocin01_07418 [Orchesella cincta]
MSDMNMSQSFARMWHVAAALTSRSENETKSTCLKNRVFDECPFVWKNYSERGYLTSFGEDSGKEGGIFVTYWKGFSKPPTDFYFRPYGVFTEEKLRKDWTDVCYGPRLAWEVLLNYAQKLAYIMNKEDQRYF